MWLVIRHAPPLPFLPESVHGEPIVALAICYAGNPEVREKLIAPLRSFGDAHGEHIGVQPYASGGAYINFLSHDEAERVEFAYGDAYKRLMEVKQKYDPENLFRVNQNIRPG